MLRCLLFELLRNNLRGFNNLLSLLSLLGLELLLLLESYWDVLPRKPAFSRDLFRFVRDLLSILGSSRIFVFRLHLWQDFWKREGLVLDFNSLPGWPLLALLFLHLFLRFPRVVIASWLRLDNWLGWDPGRNLAAFPALLGRDSIVNTSGESDSDGRLDGRLDVGLVVGRLIGVFFDNRGLDFIHRLLAEPLLLDLDEMVLVLNPGIKMVADLRPGGHCHGEEEKCQDLHRVRQTIRINRIGFDLSQSRLE